MKLGLSVKTSALAIAAAMTIPSAAMAQSAVETLRDTILVTGTKKANAEDVQDVPLAVTAYGDEQLDALKVRDLQNLSYSIPNVSFDDIGTTRGVANFSIRGIGINSSIPSIDPTVGVFVDGVYLGLNGGVVLDIFDLESIEVLRGPQGILFGRNVTGGAVLLNSKRPTDEFVAEGKFAVESGLRSTGLNYYAMGGVGGPIIEDTLKGRVSFYYNNDEGYHNNSVGGPDDFGEAETWMVRPTLNWTPTDTFEVNLIYQHFESDGDGPAAQNHTNGLNQTNPFASAPRDTFEFAIDEEGFYTSDSDSVTAEINWDVPFGEGTITNIFGWRQQEGTTRGDIDATPLALFHADSTTDQDQISNELRYAGRFFDAIDLTIGGYYFTQDIEYNEIRNIAFGTQFFNGGGVQDQKTYAAFGQLDIDLTEQFTLILGGRYTYEEKDVVISNLILNSNVPSVMNPSPQCDVRIPGDCIEDFVDSDDWENFTGKVGVEWRPRDDLNVYAHFTQGVRSGGYNFRNTSLASVPVLGGMPNPAFNPLFQPGPFDEEKVDAWEVGFKAQPADGIATVNAALFVNNIEDMQRELNLADPLTGVVQVITNTADAQIWGFEMESQIALSENFLLQGSLGYVNGEYESLLFDIGTPAVTPGAVTAEDLQLEIPRLAPWTWGLGFIYSRDMGNMGTLNSRFRYYHRDQSFYTDNNLGFLNEVDSIDASIGLTTFDDRVTVSLYGKNLLHEVQFGGDTQLPPALGGGTFSPLSKGRIVGIEIQLSN